MVRRKVQIYLAPALDENHSPGTVNQSSSLEKDTKQNDGKCLNTNILKPSRRITVWIFNRLNCNQFTQTLSIDAQSIILSAESKHRRNQPCQQATGRPSPTCPLTSVPSHSESQPLWCPLLQRHQITAMYTIAQHYQCNASSIFHFI